MPATRRLSSGRFRLHKMSVERNPLCSAQVLCNPGLSHPKQLSTTTYLISQHYLRGSRQYPWTNADANALPATAAARSPVAPGIRGVSKSEPAEADPEVTNASERSARREMRERKRELRRRRRQLTQVKRNTRKTALFEI